MTDAEISTVIAPGETLAVTVPEIDCVATLAHAERTVKAGELAVELAPEGFAQWIEYGEAIKVDTAQRNEGAPYATLGKAKA